MATEIKIYKCNVFDVFVNIIFIILNYCHNFNIVRNDDSVDKNIATIV